MQIRNLGVEKQQMRYQVLTAGQGHRHKHKITDNKHLVFMDQPHAIFNSERNGGIAPSFPDLVSFASSSLREVMMPDCLMRRKASVERGRPPVTSFSSKVLKVQLSILVSTCNTCI